MFSCEFCEISKDTFFTKHFLATASVRSAVEIRSLSYQDTYNFFKKQ